MTYSIDDKGRYYADPNGEWYEDTANMSDSANYNSDASEHNNISDYMLHKR